MKAVLISIQPKWCELIASGKKTVEVRKTKPKMETPFKVYIYCTRGNGELIQRKGNKFLGYTETSVCGKVIGEFVCRGIMQPYTSLSLMARESCLTEQELIDYSNGKTLYGWRIADLVIYDKPKELSEFYQNGKNDDIFYYDYCAGCPNHETPIGEYPCNECDGNRKYLYTPPQSWCYVEELKGGAE